MSATTLTTYRLSQAAAILGCSVDSLKRWEALGLITYNRVSGRRVLTDADLHTIRSFRARLFGRNRQQQAVSEATAAS